MKEIAGLILFFLMSQANGKNIPWQGDSFFIYS